MAHHAVLGALATSAALGLGLASCSGHGSSSPAPPPSQPAPLTPAELMDPHFCSGCHVNQHDQWLGSMHAYAGVDPVFLAMNARGQRETNGQLGNFCVTCHAPMAVRTGATTDGLNLATVDPALKGVTCIFCHTAIGANGSHNNPLALADDGVLRAAIPDPIDNQRPHGASYGILLDHGSLGSSALCGSCHDIQNQHGLSVETTFAEWKKSEFATIESAMDNSRTCAACHMPESDGLAAIVEGAPTRRVHDHSMPAVDLALTTFPLMDAQRTAVQGLLDPAVRVSVCVTPGAMGLSAAVTLQSSAVGHGFPSGASQDRRMWLEVVARASGQVVFQSGVVDDSQPIVALNDPNLWLFRQTMLDDAQHEVPFMWQATGTKTSVLAAPAMVGQNPSSTHAYAVPASTDRIDVRLRVVAIGQDVLDDLVMSGDLDPQYRNAMKPLTLAQSAVTWSAGQTCVP